MTTFVLVPGFWLGAWAWDDVAEPLRERGHRVLALTPPGMAERSGEPDVTIETWVADVVTALDGLSGVVLVGHSGGGPVVAAAADRARDHLAHLVLVDTGSLPDGFPHVDFLPPDAREYVRARLAAHGGRYPMPERDWLTEHGASTEGIDGPAWARLRERATPVPGGVVTLGARRAGRPDPTLPKTVVACGFDESMVRAALEAGVPAFAEMGGPEWSFVRLPTGHWPMFSEPAALARILAGLG
jgi:pimeloyl-ACP methyl ester carboxylesterase